MHIAVRKARRQADQQQQQQRTPHNTGFLARRLLWTSPECLRACRVQAARSTAVRAHADRARSVTGLDAAQKHGRRVVNWLAVAV